MAHRRNPFFIQILIALALAGGLYALPITNGGFESGLENWVTTVKSGAQASVLTTLFKNHSGSNSLEITIAGSGNQDSLVKLTTGTLVLDTSRVYMLRFWAIAKNRAALLDVRIGTATSNRRCHFEIYDSEGPWHRYQFLFKPAVKEAALTLSFGTATTYSLDDVELLDDQDAQLDIKTQHMWQSSHVGYGWISGDNDVSVPLPDGRTAWILNDSFLGTLNGESNVLKDVKMINNLIVVEEHKPQATLTAVYNGVPGEPKGLFPPTAFTLYWIGDGMVVGNTLQVLLQEWNVAYKFNNSAFVATLSLPDLKVQSMTKTAYKGSDIPNALLQEKAYTFIYTAERPDTLNRYTRIARIPSGSIDPKAPWEFLANDRSWTTDIARAGRMIEGTEIASAVKIGDSNYAFSGVRNRSNELAVWFSKTPTGPWTAPVIVYTAPVEAGVIPYLGHIHKGTKKDGVYTLSYSLFPAKGGWYQQLSDRGCYLPQYIRVNLEKLSPYTKLQPTALAVKRKISSRKAGTGYSLSGRRLDSQRMRSRTR